MKKGQIFFDRGTKRVEVEGAGNGNECGGDPNGGPKKKIGFFRWFKNPERQIPPLHKLEIGNDQHYHAAKGTEQPENAIELNFVSGHEYIGTDGRADQHLW